jgi:hypothetical protein
MEKGLKKYSILCIFLLNFLKKEFTIEEVCNVCGYNHSTNFVRKLLDDMINQSIIIQKGYKDSEKINRPVRTYVINLDRLLESYKDKPDFFFYYLLIRNNVVNSSFGILEPDVYGKKEFNELKEKYKNNKVMESEYGGSECI